MKHLVAGVIAVVGLMGSSVARAGDTSAVQELSVSSAVAGCYVDSPAFDYPTPEMCFGVGSTRQGTAVFVVMGLDQTGGRYTVQWLDGTCDSIGSSVQEGSFCIRSIRYGVTQQRVQVIDNWTGQVSPILSAYAEYGTNA